MASTSTKTDQRRTFVPDLEAASERLWDANDRLLDAGRKVTGAYLDGFERYVTGVTRFERQLGAQVPGEGFGSFLDAHASLTDDVAKAGVAAARELIRA